MEVNISDSAIYLLGDRMTGKVHRRDGRLQMNKGADNPCGNGLEVETSVWLNRDTES